MRVHAGEVDGEGRGDKIINMIWAYLPCCVHHGGFGDLGRVEGGGDAEQGQHGATVPTAARQPIGGAICLGRNHILV